MILELLQIRPMPVLVSNNQDKEKGTKKKKRAFRIKTPELYYNVHTRAHQLCNSGKASKNVDVRRYLTVLFI